MKISMWMLAYEMRQFSFSVNIQDSQMNIENISFFEEMPDFFLPRYVYIGKKKDYFGSDDESDALILVHRYSYILLYPMPIEHAINKILRVFEKYQKWEQEVRMSCLSQEPFQRLADCCTEIFQNPVTIADPSGVLLGYTRAMDGWDPDPLWQEILKTGVLPEELLLQEQTTLDGQAAAEWSKQPRIYHTALNRCLGAHIVTEGDHVGGFAVSEILHPLDERDIQLAERLIELMEESGLFSRADSRMIADDTLLLHALHGVEPDPEALNRFLSHTNPPPWYLLQICFLKRRSLTLRRTLIRACKISRIPNTVAEYEDNLVILTAQGKELQLLKEIIPSQNQDSFRIGISMPVKRFYQIPLALRQSEFSLKAAPKLPGTVYCQDQAVLYFESMLQDRGEEAGMLAHPALGKLLDYDKAHKSDLYHTLFVYLTQERNLIRTAQSLFIHRNTLIWRIQRIRDLTELNLDDPYQRRYLLYSYAVSGNLTQEE